LKTLFYVRKATPMLDDDDSLIPKGLGDFFDDLTDLFSSPLQSELAGVIPPQAIFIPPMLAGAIGAAASYSETIVHAATKDHAWYLTLVTGLFTCLGAAGGEIVGALLGNGIARYLEAKREHLLFSVCAVALTGCCLGGYGLGSYTYHHETAKLPEPTKSLGLQPQKTTTTYSLG
jgi:hypothetical protein